MKTFGSVMQKFCSPRQHFQRSFFSFRSVVPPHAHLGGTSRGRSSPAGQSCHRRPTCTRRRARPCERDELEAGRLDSKPSATLRSLQTKNNPPKYLYLVLLAGWPELQRAALCIEKWHTSLYALKKWHTSLYALKKWHTSLYARYLYLFSSWMVNNVEDCRSLSHITKIVPRQRPS